MASEIEASQTNEKSSIKVRCLVQQCLKSKLYTRLADPQNNIEPEFVEVY
jgi:hypothetical protein